MSDAAMVTRLAVPIASRIAELDIPLATLALAIWGLNHRDVRI